MVLNVDSLDAECNRYQPKLTTAPPSYANVRLSPDGTWSVYRERPEEPDRQREQFTYVEDEYWDGTRRVKHVEAVENQLVTALNRARVGELSEEAFAALFDAYEQAGDYESLERLIRGVERAPGLSLLEVTIYHSPKKPMTRPGLEGLQPRAKRSIRCNAVVIQKLVDIRTLGFFTFTIPGIQKGVSDGDRKLINENWGELTRQLMQQLKRDLERRGLPNYWLYVNEIQEKRYLNKGQWAIHTHVLMPLRKYFNSPWSAVADRCRELWQSILETFLGHPIDVSAAVNIEDVKSEGHIVDELAKYMSKGGSILKDARANGLENEIPHQWWGSSHPLKQEVQDRTHILKGTAAQVFIKQIEQLQEEEVVRYIPIEIELPKGNGETTTVRMGYAGFFYSSQEMCKWLREHGVPEKTRDPVREFVLPNNRNWSKPRKATTICNSS